MSSCRNSGSQPRHHCQGRCGRCFIGFTKCHGVLSHWIESGSAGWPGRDACFRRAGAGAWLKRLAWVKPSTKLLYSIYYAFTPRVRPPYVPTVISRFFRCSSPNPTDLSVQPCTIIARHTGCGPNPGVTFGPSPDLSLCGQKSIELVHGDRGEATSATQHRPTLFGDETDRQEPLPKSHWKKK